MSSVNSLFRFAVTAAIFCGCIIYAMAPARAASEAKVRAAFNEADSNADGKLEIDEYVAYMVQRFALADKDRDGYLLPGDIPKAGAKKFQETDSDGDGRVSLGEAVGAKVISYFDADTDHDGMMSLAELLAFQARKPGMKKGDAA